MYLTEAEVNTWLGISGQTDFVNQMIAAVSSYINSYCNVESFEENLTGVEQVFEYGELFMTNYPNPIGLLEINGVAYTGVKNTDYKIRYKQEFVFKDRNNIEYDDFDEITFKYSGGYNSTSQEYKDIQSAALLIIEGIYKDNKINKGTLIKKIEQGDIKKEFDNGKISADEILIGNINKANTILNKYKLCFVNPSF